MTEYAPTPDESRQESESAEDTQIHLAEFSTAELREALNAAQRREDAEKNERAKSVTPRYKFTLLPFESRFSSDRVLVEGYRYYQLKGEVLNKDELSAVGKVPFEGAGNYLWSDKEQHFITMTGGGSFFISTPEAWRDLSAFIQAVPEGGDVSVIVTRHRALRD